MDNLDAFNLRDHAKRLIVECIRLGTADELKDLGLAEWAHMPGFRGHFSTRSRNYATTLGALRAAREDHARDHEITTGRPRSSTRTPSS
ncbi:replication initiator [Nonomuraea sp. NPDC050556]|uniref:replication initiator n=1 Tax=Nonomuraea sp. NPDC050556 TaxID=3364369 RepID=UPI00379C1B1D